MYRTSIGIKDADFSTIKAYAAKKSFLLADYIRHLITIGLKVETAAENQFQGTSPSNLDPLNPDPFFKNRMICELESRYLIRYLIKHGFQESMEQRAAFLKEAKQKASVTVEQLLESPQDNLD